jgi:hypothetical protein
LLILGFLDVLGAQLIVGKLVRLEHPAGPVLVLIAVAVPGELQFGAAQAVNHRPLQAK